MTLAPLPGEKPLDAQQELFVDYLLADPRMSATLAYARAFGRRGQAARQAAARLMKDSRIRDRIRMAQAARRVTLKLEGANIVKELAAVISADPRELTEYRRGACRYCYGQGFKFQRTPAEYERELEDYLNQQKALALAKVADVDTLGLRFPVKGGIGFNPNREPHKECPECHGHGVGYTYAKDSRALSPAAARLYAGVKETKDGLEIKYRNVDKSIELAMRHLGLLDDKGKQRTPEEMASAVRELVGALNAVTPAA
jgi:hypothetical protein